MAFRSFDGFVKPMEGTVDKKASGGFITLIASTAAGLLFLSQIILYAQVQVRHSMHLAESVPSILFDHLSPDAARGGASMMMNRHRIPLRVHVTFPHVPCDSLDYAHDGNSKSADTFSHYHSKPWTFATRVPTREEVRVAVYGAARANEDHYDLPPPKEGCTLKGTIQIPRVGGSLSITVSPNAWRQATSLLSFGLGTMKVGDNAFRGKLPNVTHYVHEVQFGSPFPPGTNPLRDAHHVMDNGSGVALANVAVKLVPTTYSRPFRSDRETYQASVGRHIVQPETLAAQRSSLLPGMSISYDFTPIAVRHSETRENWMVFLSSLAGIVGGVFVTVGLVTGCLVNSAQAVAKKMD